MRTATDRLANPADNKVEVLDIDTDRNYARVRYIESGVTTAIAASHLVDFRSVDLIDPDFTPGPLKAVPGADKIDGADARTMEWRCGWAPPVGSSVAHTQRIAPDTVQLQVLFANGKRRSVGEYESHAAAQRAYHAGEYGF